MASKDQSSVKSAGQGTVRNAPDLAAEEKPKGLPADDSFKTTIDPNNVGRTVLRSKASDRALEARNQLKKLNKEKLKGLSNEEASQMARALGLTVRGTGASGEVTRGDYMTALEGRLPIPAKGAGRA